MNYDPYQVLSVVKRIWKFPRPLLIHGFLTRGPRYEAFLQAFRSLKPPVPPVFFAQPLRNGRAQVIAPNIVVGPRPAPSEFGGLLYRYGIRKYIYIGSPTSPGAQFDRQIVRNISWIKWKNLSLDKFPVFFDSLKTDGPFYIYGDLTARLKKRLAGQFGPAIPDTLQYNPDRFVLESRPTEKWHSGKTPKIYAGILLFIRKALPDFRMIILWGPFLLLYTLLCAAWVGYLRIQKNIATPYTRKIFHFSIFTMAGILQIVGGLPAVVLFGSLVSLCVLIAVGIGDGFPFYEALARPTDAPHRSLFILVPLATTALGGVLANFFFSPFSYIGYLVGGWGDAIAEPVGTRWGKHKYYVPSLAGVRATRSIEGSSAVWLASMMITFVILLLTHYPPTIALKTALLCATAATLVEAISNHGLDNLTIQLTAAGVAYWILG